MNLVVIFIVYFYYCLEEEELKESYLSFYSDIYWQKMTKLKHLFISYAFKRKNILLLLNFSFYFEVLGDIPIQGTYWLEGVANMNTCHVFSSRHLFFDKTCVSHSINSSFICHYHLTCKYVGISIFLYNAHLHKFLYFFKEISSFATLSCCTIDEDYLYVIPFFLFQDYIQVIWLWIFYFLEIAFWIEMFCFLEKTEFFIDYWKEFAGTIFLLLSYRDSNYYGCIDPSSSIFWKVL